MKTRSEGCHSCCYWELGIADSLTDGICRRFPPTVYVVMIPGKGQATINAAPITNGLYWCGEHRAKSLLET